MKLDGDHFGPGLMQIDPLPLWRRYERKTIFTFSFPVTWPTFIRPQICSHMSYLRYVSINIGSFYGFEKIGGTGVTGRTDRQTDWQTDGVECLMQPLWDGTGSVTLTRDPTRPDPNRWPGDPSPGDPVPSLGPLVMSTGLMVLLARMHALQIGNLSALLSSIIRPILYSLSQRIMQHRVIMFSISRCYSCNFRSFGAALNTDNYHNLSIWHRNSA